MLRLEINRPAGYLVSTRLQPAVTCTHTLALGSCPNAFALALPRHARLPASVVSSTTSLPSRVFRCKANDAGVLLIHSSILARSGEYLSTQSSASVAVPLSANASKHDKPAAVQMPQHFCHTAKPYDLIGNLRYRSDHLYTKLPTSTVMKVRTKRR